MELPSDFTIIDLETTGLYPDYDKIIEICALRVQNLTVTDSWCSLINPEEELDDFIVSLTGITNDMLMESPTLDSVLDQFLSFVNDSCLMGHNVNFDINFLYDSCMSLRSKPFRNNFVDTMRLSRRIFPDRSSHKLTALSNDLALQSAVHHRAEADCYCVFELYQRMLNKIADDNMDASLLLGPKSYHVRAADIVADSDANTDPNSPLFGKVCVFTGKLNRFTREQAMQTVANLGGINGDNVTKSTHYLILGNYDYISSIEGGKSKKHIKAEQLLLAGQDIEIMPEDVFYEMLSSN